MLKSGVCRSALHAAQPALAAVGAKALRLLRHERLGAASE